MGVPIGKYDIFRDFKRRVLDKAIDEVNTYSDLIIYPELSRERRKVVKIRFGLKERVKKTRLGNKTNKVSLIQNDELKTKLLCDFGFSPDQVEELMTKYDHHFIQEKIALIEMSKTFKEGTIQNLAGYLLSALKQNYQSSKTKYGQITHIQDRLLNSELGELRRQVEQIRFSYNGYRERAIQEKIHELDSKERTNFMQQFFSFAEPVINTILQLQRNKYSRENILESPQIQALLRQYAVRELDLFSLCSLEEFVAQQKEEKRAAWQKLKSYDPDHPLLRFSE